VNKAVSDYMREMQRRSAESRWSALSPADRSAKMKALRALGAKKKRTKNKARPLRQNAELTESAPENLKR
jgi:predicted Fe-S protein YdhL (DUF1289 family)